MMDLIIPGLVLGGFALISASGLFFASKKFYVFEDPRIEEVTQLLPGANCGGCGYAGCAAYADNVISKMNLAAACPVASPEAMTAIGALLGLDAPVGEKKVASLMCQGTPEHSKYVMKYHGIVDCWAALLVADTTKACAYSCIGLSSCVRACAFDAVRIENGILIIDEEKCTGCGVCLTACPKKLLHLRPISKKITVACFNSDRGPEARKACAVACIGCMKCEKVCADNAIHVTNFLAKIAYEKCSNCAKCVEACPTNSIILKGQIAHAIA